MKELYVKRMTATDIKAADIPALMKAEGITYTLVDEVNWPEAFPYCPRVEVAIAHSGDAILLHYRIEEQSVRAVAMKDDENIWEDACAEFFLCPTNDGIYYNIECNCAGRLLVGAGADRSTRVRAKADILQQIDRWASLGNTPFDIRQGYTQWQLALRVPCTTFFQHHIASLEGCQLTGNFYKCGDKLPVPHFVSWNPISWEKPNFHCPAFFGKLIFE